MSNPLDLLIVENSERDSLLRELQKTVDWEKAFDAIIDPIMILDTDYRIVKANQAMADTLSMTPAETAGLICCSAVHGLDGPPPYCPHAQMLADGNPHSVEVFEPRWGGDFLVVVSPLHDSDGNLCGSVHYARDISARKQAEQKSIRLNRIYTVLSKFNEAIVRIREPERLYKDCRRARLVPHGLDGGCGLGNAYGETGCSLWP
jgi:PAS domain S-box-containing protein